MVINIHVEGVPRPGGSKSLFINRKTGKVIVAPGSKHSKAWMTLVAEEAKRSWTRPLLDGFIELSFLFLLPRPKHHYKKGTIKDVAPRWHSCKPDLTKLIRSTEDALTGIVWVDDSRVVKQVACKRYCDEGESPGVLISIEKVQEGIEKEIEK